MIPTNSANEAFFDNNQIRSAMMEMYAPFFLNVGQDMLQSVTAVYSLVPCVAEMNLMMKSNVCVRLHAVPFEQISRKLAIDFC